ncbi:MAG: fibronectin type III domain-containing protein [Candidatus Fermentibacteraceae bacterium]
MLSLRAAVPALVLLAMASAAVAQQGAEPVAPPGEVTVSDVPNDAGDQLAVSFEPSPDHDRVEFYTVYRREQGEGDEAWRTVKVLFAGQGTAFVDGLDPDFPVQAGQVYEYRVGASPGLDEETLGAAYTAQEVPQGEWFNTGKVRILIGCALFLGLIFWFFNRAQSGDKLYLRPIPGIEAIDEAIGRATEMGKPILYVPGLSTISDVATIASLTILGRVAKKVAEYQTPLMVPNRDPIVYTVAEESVKQAYIEAGRPDAYDEDSVFYLTQSQFAFVAGVNGIMAREKPATNFYLGMFWAESLILAETGSLSGAIQIAGTDAVTQLPFFITTCDYTLIGEELYAASAYLGREPKQLGAIKGQDWFKAIIMLIIVGTLALGILDLIAGTDLVAWLDHLVTSPAAI